MANRSRVFFFGPGSSGCATCTAGALDLYVDPVNGNDSASGKSTLEPVQTLERIDELIPFIVEHPVRVHMASGTYPMTRSWILSTRFMRGDGYVHFLADDVWDPAVYATLYAGVAAAGTGAGVVVDSVGGIVVNTYRGRWLEMTDGAAVGQRRTVRNNTATDLVPAEGFGVISTNVPAPGDAFRVFRSAVIIDFSGVTSTLYAEPHQWIGGSPPAYPVEGVPVTPPSVRYEGIRFRPNAQGLIVFNGLTYHDGVEVESFGTGTGEGAWIVAGQPEASLDDSYSGWGLTSAAIYAGTFFQQTQASAVGYVVCSTVLQCGGVYYGGFAALANLRRDDTLSLFGGSWGVGAFLLGAVVGSQTGTFNLNGVEFVSSAGPLVEAGRRSLIKLDGTSVTGAATGAVTVSAQVGGTVVIENGAPVLGKAVGTDWDVGDGAPVNKAFYAAAGALQFFNGSLIERYT